MNGTTDSTQLSVSPTICAQSINSECDAVPGGESAGPGSPPTPAGRRRSLTQGPQASLRLPRILWIDDQLEPDDAGVTLLRLEGFDVEVAFTGGEGLAKARASRFDAVLLDLRLPDMYGLSVLSRLMSWPPTAPVRRCTEPPRFTGRTE